MSAIKEWSGTWTHRFGPNGTQVRWSGVNWLIVDRDGNMVSRHKSRTHAIRRGKEIDLALAMERKT